MWVVSKKEFQPLQLSRGCCCYARSKKISEAFSSPRIKIKFHNFSFLFLLPHLVREERNFLSCFLRFRYQEAFMNLNQFVKLYTTFHSLLILSYFYIFWNFSSSTLSTSIHIFFQCVYSIYNNMKFLTSLHYIFKGTLFKSTVMEWDRLNEGERMRWECSEKVAPALSIWRIEYFSWCFLNIQFD